MIDKALNIKLSVSNLQQDIFKYFLEYKLDEAYIARYLGNLSMKEENHLMQLRRRFQVAHVGKVVFVTY